MNSMDSSVFKLLGSIPGDIGRYLVCLSWSNLRIDDSFRAAATLAACEMLAGSRSNGKFEEEVGHGKLETSGRRVTCGSITGILFKGTFFNRLSGQEGEISFMIDDRQAEGLIKYLTEQAES